MRFIFRTDLLTVSHVNRHYLPFAPICSFSVRVVFPSGILGTRHKCSIKTPNNAQFCLKWNGEHVEGFILIRDLPFEHAKLTNY